MTAERLQRIAVAAYIEHVSRMGTTRPRRLLASVYCPRCGITLADARPVLSLGGEGPSLWDSLGIKVPNGASSFVTGAAILYTPEPADGAWWCPRDRAPVSAGDDLEQRLIVEWEKRRDGHAASLKPVRVAGTGNVPGTS